MIDEVALTIGFHDGAGIPAGTPDAPAPLTTVAPNIGADVVVVTLDAVVLDGADEAAPKSPPGTEGGVITEEAIFVSDEVASGSRKCLYLKGTSSDLNTKSV